jgi:lipoyl(octanoyl) transferase
MLGALAGRPGQRKAWTLQPCWGTRSTVRQEAEQGVEWRVSPGVTAYPDAFAAMAARAAAIRDGTAGELVWLLQHPPLFTAGTSADPAELFNPQGLPVYEAGRGGRYTYHGPGQRVGYVLIDLERRGKDVRRYVHSLEGWVIASLAQLGVPAWRAPGRIGIWVHDAQGREAKVGAIGVRVGRWVTSHGFAINVDPLLSDFAGIVPCGISDFPVTSLAAIGLADVALELDRALRREFAAFLAALGGEM